MTAPRPDVPLLADLDAGVLDDARAREVRAAADADPAARAVLDALAATRAALAATPDPPVPEALAARWSAALRAEQALLAASAEDPRTPAAAPRQAEAKQPPPDPDTEAAPLARRDNGQPSRRGPRAGGRRTLLRRPAVLAGVLLLAVLVGAGLLQARQEPLLLVDRPHLMAQGLSTVGVHDTGGLDDAVRRAACLRAVAAPGVRPDAPLLGGRRVTFEGTPGDLLILGTGKLATFDIVIVDPGCGTAGGTLVAATHVVPP